jgi:uncharacterized protein DUF4035
LLDTISWEELQEWAALYSRQPFGPWREDFRAAQICAVIANTNRNPKTKKDPYTPQDFMPFDRKPTEEPEDKIAPETRAWFYAAARKNEKLP